MVFINYSEFSKLKTWFRTHAFPVLIIPMLRSLSHVYISFMLCTTTPHFTLYLARPSLFSCLVSSLLACVLNWGPIYPEKRPITTAHFCVHVMLAQHHKTTFFLLWMPLALSSASKTQKQPRSITDLISMSVMVISLLEARTKAD